MARFKYLHKRWIELSLLRVQLMGAALFKTNRWAQSNPFSSQTLCVNFSDSTMRCYGRIWWGTEDIPIPTYDWSEVWFFGCTLDFTLNISVAPHSLYYRTKNNLRKHKKHIDFTIMYTSFMLETKWIFSGTCDDEKWAANAFAHL